MDIVTRIINRVEWAAWTSTERVHEQTKRATWQTEMAYCRFNVEIGIESVRRDEWKTRESTNKTLALMESTTTQYMQQSEVDQELQNCAERLVQLHRRQL